MDTGGLHAEEGGLEEALGGTEALAADGDDLHEIREKEGMRNMLGLTLKRRLVLCHSCF